MTRKYSPCWIKSNSDKRLLFAVEKKKKHQKYQRSYIGFQNRGWSGDQYKVGVAELRCVTSHFRVCRLSCWIFNSILFYLPWNPWTVRILLNIVLAIRIFQRTFYKLELKFDFKSPPPKPCTKTYHGNRGVGHTARGTEAAPPPCNGWFRGPMLNVAFAGNEKESIIHVGTLHRLQERRQEPVSLTFPCWLWQRFKRLTIFSSIMI